MWCHPEGTKIASPASWITSETCLAAKWSRGKLEQGAEEEQGAEDEEELGEEEEEETKKSGASSRPKRSKRRRVPSGASSFHLLRPATLADHEQEESTSACKAVAVREGPA